MAIFEQDFLMRQIQQLTQLLQEIIFKKSQNQKQDAVQQIRNAFQRITKDHPKQFHELSLEETISIFEQNQQFQSQLALAVADLLIEEGDMLDDKSHSTSQKCYTQALLLYKKSLREDGAAVPIDIQQKIDTLQDLLHHSDYLGDINRILNH